MKKAISVIVLCALLSTVFCTSAFAKSPVAVVRDGEEVSVSASTLDPNEETTILVVKEGTSISGAFANTLAIHHIDQVSASNSGVATFDFKYSGTDALDIYIGYATMSATDAPFEAVVDKSGTGGDEPDEDAFVYGDVNNDGSIDLADASDVINYFLHGSAFVDSNTEEEYEYGENAADVNIDESIDLADASDVINYFLHGTEFDANKQ